MANNYNKSISDTTVRLGEVRFSYAYVFEPRKGDDGEQGKYSVCVLIPKTDKQAIALVEQAMSAAEQTGKVTKWGGKIPARLSKPLRDGDAEEKGPEYEGMMFFNASSKIKPDVRVLDNGHLAKALDVEDFYSGCYGAVTVNFYPYDTNGNRGVGAGLNNVVRTRDGERLAGGTSADVDFGDLVDDLLD